MSWDQALLRKFSNTSHFRLLNQLRGELRSHPIVREHPTKSQTGQSRIKKIDAAQEPTSIQKRETTITSQPNNQQDHIPQGIQQSFRERLNAVQMK